jgi:hypothetical protein
VGQLISAAPLPLLISESANSAIHFENQPHKFVIVLTVSRSHNKAAGGHFYMSKYGIRIAAAPNTLVVWTPSDPHGTSLQNFAPGDQGVHFFQRGLAFVTSACLPSIWATYQRAQLSRAQAVAALHNEGSGSEDEKFKKQSA